MDGGGVAVKLGGERRLPVISQGPGPKSQFCEDVGSESGTNVSEEWWGGLHASPSDIF